MFFLDRTNIYVFDMSFYSSVDKHVQPAELCCFFAYIMLFFSAFFYCCRQQYFWGVDCTFANR